MKMTDEWTVKAGWELDIDDDDIDALYDIFEDAGIEQYFSEDVVALARSPKGKVIGGITEGGGEELSIAVDDGWRHVGVGLSMMEAFLNQGGGGYMVAGTTDGLDFLISLKYRLSEEHKEMLDIPCWEQAE